MHVFCRKMFLSVARCYFTNCEFHFIFTMKYTKISVSLNDLSHFTMIFENYIKSSVIKLFIKHSDKNLLNVLLPFSINPIRNYSYSFMFQSAEIIQNESEYGFNSTYCFRLIFNRERICRNHLTCNKPDHE